MFNKNKNNNNHKKDWIIIFLGFWSFLKVLKLFKKKKNKKIKENFIKFLRKEENEIEELVEGKENAKKYLEDSGNIFKDFFVPTKENGYKPKILRTKTLVVGALLLAGLKLILASYLFFIYPYQGRMDEFFNDQLLSLINRDRISQELGTLQFDKELNFSAVEKAKDLVQNDYFAHINPEGKKPWDWINRDNYRYLLVGENLAMNFTTPESVHKALMLSPSHKKNILNKEYKDIGLAVLNGNIDGKETRVLVELFSVKKQEEFKLSSVSSIQEKISEAEIIETQNKVVPDTAKEINKTKTRSELSARDIKEEQKENIPDIKSIPPPPKIPEIENRREKILALAGREAKVLSSELSKENANKPEEEILTDKEIDNALENMEVDNVYQTRIFTNNQDEAKAYTETKLQYFNYFLFAVLLLLFIFLIINIIIKIEVQHKSAIIQTIFLIIFISGLISLKLDFLATLLPKILVI